MVEVHKDSYLVCSESPESPHRPALTSHHPAEPACSTVLMCCCVSVLVEDRPPVKYIDCNSDK